MKQITTIMLITLSVLTSCASIPNNINNETKVSDCYEGISYKLNKDCTNKVNSYRIAKINKFVKENKQFKKYEISAIYNQIEIGMPKKLMILAKGQYRRVHTSVTKYGTFKRYEYVYLYIYTHNGLITRWHKQY